MKRVAFTSAAESEFAELVAFYDGLGAVTASDFATEVERVVERIAEFPEAGAPYTSGTRRFLLHRFPVAVVYRVQGSTLEIVALAHQRRRPDYWVLRESAAIYSGACYGAAGIPPRWLDRLVMRETMEVWAERLIGAG